MGNTSQPGQVSNHWLKQYEIVEQNLHNNIMLIQSSKTGEEYYGKLLKCSRKEEIDRIDRIINLKQSYENKYVSKIVYWNKKDTDNFCNINAEYSFVFEKGTFSLKDEIYNRKFKFQQFHQAQIMLILESVMKGLLFLQQISQKHRRICSQNIFLRQDRSVFLSDPWLHSSKPTSIFKMNQTGYNYPSPEKILFQNDLIDSYDEQLSDYYSLGIVVLELINMEPMDFIYEKGFRRILNKKILAQIDKIKRADLKERVKILVNHYPQKRKQIQKYYQKPTTTEQFIKKQIEQFKSKINSNNRQNKIHQNNKNEVNIIPYQSLSSIHHPYLRTQSSLTLSNNIRDNNRNGNNSKTVTERPKIVFTHFEKELKSSFDIPLPFNRLKFEQQQKSQVLLSYNLNPNHLHSNQQKGIQEQLKLESIRQQPPSVINQEVNKSNNLQLNQVKSSTEDPLQNYNALKDLNLKKLNQLTPLIKEAQSINVSTDQKSEAASQVIGHGFSAKNSMSIGQNSKRQSMDEVRKSMPEQSYQALPNPEPKISYTVSFAPERMSENRQQNSQQVTNAQMNTLTPDRKPVKKRNHSTIKQVSQQSPSVESHSFQYEERTILYDVGTKYIGQIKNGKRNGQGIFYFQDGSYYQGSWKDNKMHGKGCLYYSNGKLAYDGGWYMDSFHGKGRLYNDLPEDSDQEYNYKNMNCIDDHWEVYDGDFFNQRKNGNGKLKLSNGQVYVGQFMDDKVNGEGKFYQLNGNVVHGKWVEGILVKEYS